MVGCRCKTCTSTDPHDKRLRPSILLRLDDKRIVIDTGPDFRYQALRFGIERIDAVLYTHWHADHILGLDDLRPFNFMQREEIPIYASAGTMDVILHTFQYVFDTKATESSRPRLRPHIFQDEPIFPAGVEMLPIPVSHGRSLIHGFRFGDCAYFTHVSHDVLHEAVQSRLPANVHLAYDGLEIPIGRSDPQ